MNKFKVSLSVQTLPSLTKKGEAMTALATINGNDGIEITKKLSDAKEN